MFDPYRSQWVYVGAVKLAYRAQPHAIGVALAPLQVYAPRGIDVVQWLSFLNVRGKRRKRATISTADGQPLVCLEET